MPTVWTADKDAELFLTILTLQNITVDYVRVSAAMGELFHRSKKNLTNHISVSFYRATF